MGTRMLEFRRLGGQPLYFGADSTAVNASTPPPSVSTGLANPPPPSREGWAWRTLNRFGKASGYVAASLQLIGGLSLIGSSVLPGKSDQKAAPTVQQPEPPGSPTPLTPAQQAQAVLAMADIKDILNRMGWVCIGTAATMECISATGMGFRDKQPSMVVGNTLCLAMAPFFIAEPSVPLRAAYFLACAMFNAGFANKLQNELTANKKREFDLQFLTDWKGWRDSLPEAERKQLLNAWVGRAGAMLRFTLADQVLTVTSAGKSLGKVLAAPMASFNALKQMVAETNQYVQGQRKQLPDAMLNALPEQERVSVMLAYVGGLPILFLGGSLPAVNALGTKFFGASSLLANASLFVVGAHKNDWVGKALMVGIPLKVLGNAFLETNLGYGLEAVGHAPTSLYYADQYNQKKPDAAH